MPKTKIKVITTDTLIVDIEYKVIYKRVPIKNKALYKEVINLFLTPPFDGQKTAMFIGKISEIGMVNGWRIV